jgi:hypothetical protein
VIPMARRTPALALLLAVPFAAGCPNYLFEQQLPQKVHEEQSTRGGAKSPPADVLLVIDDSGSMEVSQRNLTANLDRFIHALAGKGDYHFGVVTTDLSSPNGEMGGYVKSEFASGAPYDLTKFTVGDCKVENIPHGCFRGPDPAKRLLKSSELSSDDLISQFRLNSAVGTCGSGNEVALGAIVEALQQASTSGCNEGFLRDDANLILMIISDEDDQDPARRPASQFVDQVAQFKDISKVRFAVIGGIVDAAPTYCRYEKDSNCGHDTCMNPPPAGDHAACGTSMPNACAGTSAMYPEGQYCKLLPQSAMGECENLQLRYFTPSECPLCEFFKSPDCCVSSPTARYVDFGAEIERRVHDANPAFGLNRCKTVPGKPTACLAESICQSDFGETLAKIAHELINPTVFILNPPAIYPPGIVVKIRGGRYGADGVELKYMVDFTVNPEGTELTITDPDKAPQGDEVIEIYFIVAN